MISGEIDLSIIIISYNTKGLILNCLNSIRKHIGDVRHEIIVVDELFEKMQCLWERDSRLIDHRIGDALDYYRRQTEPISLDF